MIIDIQKILDYVLNFVSLWGYTGVFFISLLDRVTISLIPTEVVLPLFGALISEGKFSFANILILVTIGSLLGEVILYYIALFVGRPFLEKYGKYILVSRHDLGHLDRLVEKYGTALVFWGRLLPAVRAFVALPAGISRFGIRKFILYSFLGMLPYNLLLIYLGLVAYNKVDILISYFNKFDYIVFLIIIFALVFYIYRHLKRRHLTHDGQK